MILRFAECQVSPTNCFTMYIELIMFVETSLLFQISVWLLDKLSDVPSSKDCLKIWSHNPLIKIFL